MGLIRKALSVSTLGAVDFRSDRERTAAYAKGHPQGRAQGGPRGDEAPEAGGGPEGLTRHRREPPTAVRSGALLRCRGPRLPSTGQAGPSAAGSVGAEGTILGAYRPRTSRRTPARDGSSTSRAPLAGR